MSAKLEHYVSQDPFEPHAAETLTPEQERFYRASQWQLMWWKFRRHRIAVIAGGRLSPSVPRGQFDRDAIGLAMSGQFAGTSNSLKASRVHSA